MYKLIIVYYNLTTYIDAMYQTYTIYQLMLYAYFFSSDNFRQIYQLVKFELKNYVYTTTYIEIRKLLFFCSNNVKVGGLRQAQFLPTRTSAGRAGSRIPYESDRLLDRFFLFESSYQTGP